MKEETYRKVFIKGESDLPKEDGGYLVCWKTDEYEVFVFTYRMNKDYWLSEVDWYLQPVTDKEATTGYCVAEQETYGEVFEKKPTERNLGEVPVEQEKPQTAEEINQLIFNDVEKFVSIYMMGVGCVEKKDIIEHDLREGISMGMIIASKYATQKHIPTDCYPKEFVEWCIKEVSSNKARICNCAYMIWVDGEGLGFNTLDELFIYWKDKIEKK